jgi:hypothetical protein
VLATPRRAVIDIATVIVMPEVSHLQSRLGHDPSPTVVLTENNNVELGPLVVSTCLAPLPCGGGKLGPQPAENSLCVL